MTPGEQRSGQLPRAGPRSLAAAWKFMERRSLMRALPCDIRTLSALGLVLASVAAAQAEPVDENNPVEFYIADQITYDDNLFRVPPSLMQTDPAAVTVQSINDYQNRASVGMHARWEASRQVFLVNLRLDNVNYKDN